MIENNSQENLIDSNENKSFNLVNDFYSPLLNSRNLYLDNTYKFLVENNTDPAEYLGVQKNPLSERIQYKSDNPELDKKNTEYSAKNFAQGFVNFMSDIPDEVVAKTVEGVLSTSKFGVNLVPFINKLIGSPINEDKIMQNSIEWSKSIDNTVNQYRRIYKDSTNAVKGRDPNSIAEFAGWAAQSYPYVVTTYQGLKKVGVPDVPAIVLSAGIGTAVSFDPKEASFTLNLFTQEIDSIKKYLEIIPDTPNNELFDRTLTLFENSFLAKYIPQIFEGAKFLKKYIPAFNEATPGTAVGVGGGTATGEIVDKTLLNPKDETIENQGPTILDNVRSGIDQFGNKLTEIGGAIKKEFSGEAMANPLVKKGAVELAPVFKSAVVDVIEKIPNKAPVEQISGIIKNTPGVTQQELKWIGLDDFLKTKSNQKFIEKKELADFIQANRIDVNEIKLGGELKLSKDFELRQKEFEKKYRDFYGDNNDFIGYDTYPIKYQELGFNEGFQKSSVTRMLDFNQTNSVMDQVINATKLPIETSRTRYANDFFETNYVPSSRLEIDKYKQTLADGSESFVLHRLFDKVSNIDKYTDTKTAEMLLTSPRFERNRIIYFEPVEIEKYLIQKEYREAAKKAGSTRFKGLTEPGGTDYTEIVLTVNQQGKKDLPVVMQNSIGTDVVGTTKTTMSYTSPRAHFGQKNEIAHVRFKTRDVKGQKILSVEELQSDLVNQMQAGDFVFATPKRKLGDFDLQEDSLKDFPFKNNWHELVTRRLVRYAADNGFDAIAFQKGIVSLRRYGMTDSVNGISVTRAKDRSASAIGEYDSVQVVMAKEDAEIYESIDGLKKYVSEEFANEIDKYIKTGTIPDSKLFRTETTSFPEMDVVTFRPKEKIETIPKDNQGRIEFYDKVIPSYLKKYAKKWNAPVYQDTIDISQAVAEQGLRKQEIPVVILKLTPEMKRSVQEKSQPLFNIVLPALTAGGSAKVISDNMENNTISNPTKN